MSVPANDWVSLRQPGSRVADLVVIDPRQEMARRLPAGLQGFLTWLTAMPADGEAAGETTALRHLAQRACPRCTARHEAGPVRRLFTHHEYLCIRHSYWIGPPDPTRDDPPPQLTSSLEALAAN